MLSPLRINWKLIGYGILVFSSCCAIKWSLAGFKEESSVPLLALGLKDTTYYDLSKILIESKHHRVIGAHLTSLDFIYMHKLVYFFEFSTYDAYLIVCYSNLSNLELPDLSSTALGVMFPSDLSFIASDNFLIELNDYFEELQHAEQNRESSRLTFYDRAFDDSLRRGTDVNQARVNAEVITRSGDTVNASDLSKPD